MIIRITDDFDLYKIINSGQCFRPLCVAGDVYRFIYKKHVLYIRSLDENYNYETSCTIAEWENIWSKYFDLNTSYLSIRSMADDNDEYLLTCISKGIGIRILNQDKWEMLVSFIISQRKSIPAIRTCIEKICVRFGSIFEKDTILTDNNISDYLRKIIDEDIDKGVYMFPETEAMADADENDLAECGLGYRTEYVMDAIRKVNDNNLKLELINDYNNDDLFAELNTVKGVGMKVANCVMLFGYHRLDRAPVDTWIAKVIKEKYNNENPFSRYGEYAGVMQQYMFFDSTN